MLSHLNLACCQTSGPSVFLRCLTLILMLAAFSPSQAAERPNILFIFADDQSFETIRELGNSEIQTPNLDQLVREGTTFTHAYNMGSWSGAVCVASRTMLNSGRFLWRANKIHSTSKKEQSEGRWWSEHMKKAGYRTYFTGKWHCKASADDSFDVTRNVRGGMPKQTPEGYNRPKADGTDPWSPSDPKFGGFWEGGKHWSEVVADDTIAFLHEAKELEEPFFMYTAFNAPHDPRQSPAEYVDLYPVESIRMPENFLPLYPYKDEIGLGTKQRDEKLGTFPRTEICVKTNRQEYYAIISHMDAQIGRILEALDASGKRENTWIFFTADHGLACGHHGLMGKQNMYDHSLRVPFIAIGPNVAKNEKRDQPIYLQDVMATTLELAGIERPEHVEFNSILPVLDGAPSQYPVIYGAFLGLQRCLRTKTHKLILYPKAKVKRLFDLTKDPEEMNDIASEPNSLPIMQEMFSQLLEQQGMLEDSLDLRGPFLELVTQ